MEFKVEVELDGKTQWLGRLGDVTDVEGDVAVFRFRDGCTGADEQKILERTRVIAWECAGKRGHFMKALADRQSALAKLDTIFLAGVEQAAGKLVAARVAGGTPHSDDLVNECRALVRSNIHQFDDPVLVDTVLGHREEHPPLAVLDQMYLDMSRDIETWQMWARWEVLAESVPPGWERPSECPHWGYAGRAVVAAWNRATMETRRGKTRPSGS